MTHPGVHLPAEGWLPPWTGATTWINSEPLTTESLRAKVVVADFCTYTCINWLRSLPYVRAWDERYRDKGLVTIGIHTPEFSFERNLDNIRSALEQMRVTYPVAVDNEYAVWNAFSNHYWPALYFVAAPGSDGLVFTAPKGGPIRRPAFYRLVWSRATRAVGLEGFPFRNLGYTGATLALQEGTNPVLVAFRLGHASTAMIERHYGELGEGFDREIADRLSAARSKQGRSGGLAHVTSLAERRSRKRSRKRRG